MLGNAHFYNRTIRKIVVAFGTLFNDIYVVRYTKDGLTAKEKFKVPLSYGSKEKYITRITSDPNLTKSIATVVPRISFELTGMSYDSGRKLPSTQRNFSAETSTSINTQYVPVPYDFSFSLSIYVRNTEDGTQILEQILPFFTPDFNVTVTFNPDMAQKYDLPIVLNSVNTTTDYEGDMMNTRLIIWDLEFTAKGHIWPPVKTASVIRQANTSIYIENRTKDAQKVYLDYANGVSYFADSEIVRVADRDIVGKVSYFSNTSNGILVVSDLNDVIVAGDIIKGDTSGAVYTVSSVDVSPVKSLLIVTTPDPITAEADDEFGFAETITEYPNTL
jgi:hypothetical protein